MLRERLSYCRFVIAVVDFVGVSPIMTPCMDISICALLNAEIHEKKSRGEVNIAR